MNGSKFGQLSQIAVSVFVVGYDVLYGCRAEEILLFEPERLAAFVIVCRIEHFGDEVGVVVFAHRLIVFALREQLHVEVLNGLSLPQSEYGNGVAVFTGDHHVVCYCFDLGAIDIFGLHAVFGPLLLDLAVEPYFERLIAPVGEPHLAAGQPYVGQFYLPAVYDLLFEQAEFVAQRIAHRGVVAGRERIHKAGCKPAEAAVAEACIRLEFIQVFKVEAV